MGCMRREGAAKGVPQKAEESKRESFWGLAERDVRAVAMVAMIGRETRLKEGGSWLG